uniref:Uncharacterized protein n=1 Tax=mine drainage metagenome TaxID=410659 RepID=E6QIX1_9ZZZZ
MLAWLRSRYIMSGRRYGFRLGWMQARNTVTLQQRIPAPERYVREALIKFLYLPSGAKFLLIL